MPRYQVAIEWSVSASGTQYVDVEADSEQDAMNLAVNVFDYADAALEIEDDDWELGAEEVKEEVKEEGEKGDG